MSRVSPAALILLASVAGEPLALAATAGNPHLDRGLLPRGCVSCHEGHGAPRSPMLDKPQKDICLRCHGSDADLERAVADGILAPGARPPLLSAVLTLSSRHPVSPTAFRKGAEGEVTCTSCHSPHRSTPAGRGTAATAGTRSPSPASPALLEFELCEGCHGGQGAATASLLDVSRLFAPTNVSFHPVEAPANGRSPSAKPAASGKFVNCTDCHGSDDRSGPRGPHGSRTPKLLIRPYATVDGTGESEETFALCYDCHNRQTVLERSAFPGHREHIVGLKASCATCHSGHGSIANRALIRYGEDATQGSVAPSAKGGRLAFVSTGPGSGSCYLTCHGKDHGPESYGMERLSANAFRSTNAPPREMVAVPAQPGSKSARVPAPAEGALPIRNPAPPPGGTEPERRQLN